MTNHTIKIFGKGSKERMIQIENPDVIKALQSYYTLFQEDIKLCGFFFINKLHNRLTEQSVREIIRKYTYMTEYDIHITPHMSGIPLLLYYLKKMLTFATYKNF